LKKRKKLAGGKITKIKVSGFVLHTEKKPRSNIIVSIFHGDLPDIGIGIPEKRVAPAE